MNKMNIREARRQFSALVDAAQRGETTVILRNGHPVAQIRQEGPDEKKKLPDLTEFRSGIKVTGKPLSQVIIEQRRKGY